MATNLKQLQEALRPPAAEIRKLADIAQERAFTAEEEQRWVKVNEDYNALEKRIGQVQRADEINASLAPSEEVQRIANATTLGKRAKGGDGATSDDWAMALQGFCRYGQIGINEEHETAAARCGLNIRTNQFVINLPQRPVHCLGAWASRNGQFVGMQGNEYGAALSGMSPASGSVLVPTSFVNRFELSMVQFGGIRRVAEIMRTSSGETMTWPTGDDTSNTGRLISESPTITNLDPSPGFKATVWNAYMYTSDYIKVPFSLLEDSAVDLPAIIGQMLGERIGRATSAHFTTGDGAAKPYGIITAATTGVTTASSTAIAADELINLVHSIDPAYRYGPNVGWAFHDSIFLALRKLKNGTGDYMWQESLSSGEPNRLLDYPYTIIQEMASSIATTNKTVLFGALNYYKIRDVGQYRLRRLDELGASSDQVWFVALSRHDGNLLDPGAHPVKIMVQV